MKSFAAAVVVGAGITVGTILIQQLEKELKKIADRNKFKKQVDEAQTTK